MRVVCSNLLFVTVVVADLLCGVLVLSTTLVFLKSTFVNKLIIGIVACYIHKLHRDNA